MILAGIDIGTNTLRLLIADTGPGYLRELTSHRRITRLGEELDRCGALTPEAMDRSLAALVAFQKIIQQQGVRHISAVGTSALRKAKNASAFLDQVRKLTGLVVNVICGEEEARLTLLGVEQSLATPDGSSNTLADALIIDIGGGSTEIILTNPDKKPVIASLSLGAVYLHDKFIKHDPPLPGELASLRNSVREELEERTRTFQLSRESRCVGTAGTITTLAAICQGLASYNAEKINRSVLTLEFMNAMVMKLGVSTLEERRKIKGLEKGREDIILSGAVLAQEIMHRFKLSSMIVCEGGLREGIVLDLSERLHNQNSLKHTQV